MSRENGTPFGRLLRQRRKRHGLTQERLAARADLSTRHVSFLETGRSNPSRDSVLALSRAMELPLRDRNTLLRAAGLPAVYPERDLLAEDSHVRSLFEFLLRRHEPYPAYVIDHAWTVEMHNRAAVSLVDWLLEQGSSALAGTNQLRLLFDPDGLRPLTVNFDAVGRFLLDRLEEEIALRPGDDELEELRRELEGYGPMPTSHPGRRPPDSMPALPVHLRKDGTDLRLLSFLMTVAAPREVGLQEIRMETFLPADEESVELLESIAGP